MYFEPDPYTGFRLKPQGKGYFQNSIPAQANIHGHRDDEVLLSKSSGVYRILILGDSFTVGANVAQEEAYPQVLERLLKKNYSSSIEIVNTGVGGWDPFQYAQYYEYYGYQFAPDYILIGFFVGNDTYNQYTHVSQLPTAVMGRRISRQDTSDRFIKIKIFMYQHFNLARLVLTKGYAATTFMRRNCQDFTQQYLDIQRTRMKNHLKQDERQYQLAQNGITQILYIKRLAERTSVPLLVVLLPDENQINLDLQKTLLQDGKRERYDFDMPQSMLKEILAEHDIPVIDLLPYFRRDTRCLYMNDTHWTPEGHRLAAQIIYEELPKFIKISGNVSPF